MSLPPLAPLPTQEDLDLQVATDALQQQDLGATEADVASQMQEPPDPELLSLNFKDPTGGLLPFHEDLQSEKERKEVVDGLKEIFEKYRGARSTVVERIWERAEAIYEGDALVNPHPYQSFYDIREVYSQVESMKAKSADLFFGLRKRFDLHTQHDGGEDSANIATHIIVKQNKMLGWEEELLSWHDQAFITATSYLEYGWAQFRRVHTKITRMDENTPTWKREVEEIPHGGPYFEHLDCWSVFTNPWVPKLENSPFVFKVETVSSEYLLTMVAEGKFDAKAVNKALKLGGDVDPSKDKRTRKWLPQQTETLMGEDNCFELVTCWTTTGWEYVYVGGETLVRGNYNVFGRVPILTLKDNPRHGMAYGVPIATILEPEQLLLNDIASLWVDSIHYRLQPMFVVAEAMRNQWDALQFMPGATFYAERPKEDVQALPTTAQGFELSNSMEFVRRGMQRTSGQTDEVLGQGSRHRTATGLHALQEAAAVRDKYRAIRWQSVIGKVYETAYALNAAFLDEEVSARVEGLDGKMLSGRYGAEHFSPEVDVEVLLPTTMEPPEVRQTRSVTMYTALSKDPLVNREYLLQEVARAHEISPRRLIVSRPRSQSDAIYENQDFLSSGFMADPTAGDDHAIHYQIHEMMKQTVQFQKLPPEVQAVAIRHCQIHERYLQEMQAMTQTPMANPSMATPIEAQGNQLANDSLNMGAMGAAQQGVPL